MSRGGHPHRLPVLRVRLPRPDDALPVQPHPVEPAVLEGRAGQPCYGAPNREFLHFDLAAPRCSGPRRSPGSSQRRPERERRNCRKAWPPPRPASPLPQWTKARHVRGLTPPPRDHDNFPEDLTDDIHGSACQPARTRRGRPRRLGHHRRRRRHLAWTEAAMFRVVRNHLRAGPQADFIVMPCICGHLRRQPPVQVGLRAGPPAHDGAAQRHPGAQHRPGLRNPAVDSALLLRPVRHRPDEQEHAKSPMYGEAVRRYAPCVVGQLHQRGVVLSGENIGRGLCDLRRAVAALQFLCPAVGWVRRRSSDVPRHRHPGELEGHWLGPTCLVAASTAGWRTRPGGRCWPGSTRTSRNATATWALIRFSPGRRPGQRPGCRQLHRHRHLLRSEPLPAADHRGPQRRAHRPGRHLRRWAGTIRVRSVLVREDVTHSFLRGQPCVAPVRGETIPIDPEKGRGQGRVQLGQVPRYEVEVRVTCLWAGPLARRMAAAGPAPHRTRDNDPLFLDICNKIGPAMVRQLARLQRRPSTTAGSRLALISSTSGELLQQAHRARRGQGLGPLRPACCRTGSSSRNGKIKNY